MKKTDKRKTARAQQRSVKDRKAKGRAAAQADLKKWETPTRRRWSIPEGTFLRPDVRLSWPTLMAFYPVPKEERYATSLDFAGAELAVGMAMAGLDLAMGD